MPAHDIHSSKTSPRKRKTATRSAAKSAGQTAPAKKSKKWSAGVTKNSDALDLSKGIFTSGDPKKIARSLERSAEKSTRKKGTPYQSAMSMLNFYINRAGKNLPPAEKKILEKAKKELSNLKKGS